MGNLDSDLSYANEGGLFTVFYANTAAGVAAWKFIAEQNSGTGKIFTTHLDSTLQQLRKAGYTVKQQSKSEINDDELLNELLE